jgi:Ca2+-binding EF-hand superfamily protein
MDDPSPDLIKDANIHHQLNESYLSYRELFRRLDNNHDGRIEVNQLIKLLEKGGLETSANKRWATARVSFICFSFFIRKIILFFLFIAYYRSGWWIPN